MFPTVGQNVTAVTHTVAAPSGLLRSALLWQAATRPWKAVGSPGWETARHSGAAGGRRSAHPELRARPPQLQEHGREGQAA